ncbi:hypothetical protein CDL12_24670 [Handroanthus impetiginosus]|uniref:Transcription repressor n=1 Tax=Handroanthus impetiginosus TaxID=429701 RepID=A0A2G9GC93_9LAMI|nr:hypothetical protein CDL12_24670 [Handroanthus impetiginosus]
MGKKKLPFLCKPAAAAAVSWPWPGCANTPKTLSFREYNKNNYFEQESFPSESETEDSAVIRGLKAERLIFKPGETNSILEEAKTETPYKVLAIDSKDPFIDFRVSMEEMVEAYGIKEWKFLEELLAWYLQANGESNQGYIVAAFVDLVIHLSASVSSDCSGSDIDENCSSSSTTTQYSFTSSSSLLSLCNGLISGL